VACWRGVRVAASRSWLLLPGGSISARKGRRWHGGGAEETWLRVRGGQLLQPLLVVPEAIRVVVEQEPTSRQLL